MKSAIFASLIATAAAFAPVQQQASSTALRAFEDALGSQPPLGFFDPLGLVEDGDQEKFDRLRFVEIKHGRICMLAFLGQITTRNGVHLPGDIDYSGNAFDSFPNGWAAISGPDAIPSAGLAQIVAFVAALELGVMKDIEGTGNEFVGDFRNGSLDFGWDTFDEETKLSKRAIELNNGRAAMMGILGLMVHEQLGGTLPIVGEM
uniref:Fucoxanthin-chlorophyll a/c light-harvesting protein n=1 Tax=Pseudo-nitzschia australis TaxID=44445 RepID=A0A7S4AQW3_9STRA